MAHDKPKMDERDRSRVAADQDYEVRYFAERHGISMDQARDLIWQYGNDWDRLKKEASRLA
jgi:Protein of unknown function (DUF3606)